MSTLLEQLGLSQEELQERIIERAADQLLSTRGMDEDGNESTENSELHKKLKDMVSKRVDAAITEIGNKHVQPAITSIIEGAVLQATTEWGEKKGDPMTFTQYLVKRAEKYMHEEVDMDGKSKGESTSYSWSSSKQTRMTHAIHKHLRYSIETAMQTILSDANKHLVSGIKATVESKLQEIVSSITVNCKK